MAQAADPLPPNRPRWYRLLARLGQGVAVFVIGFLINYAYGVAQVVLQQGSPALLPALTNWQLASTLARQAPWLFWPLVVVLLVLVLLGLRERGHRSPTAAIPVPLPYRFGPPQDFDQLPPPLPLIGREADLAWLRARLQRRAPLSVLRGLPGIGKSALVAAAIRETRHQFPAGVVVLRCVGGTDPIPLMRSLLGHFDPYRRPPEATEEDALLELVRGTLRHRHAVIVLDHVEPGLPLGRFLAACREAEMTVVITATHHLPPEAASAEATREVEVPTPQAAARIFTDALARDAAHPLTAADQTAITEIVTLLACHPLAIQLTGATARQTGRLLPLLLAELRAQAAPLGVEGVPEAVQRSFAVIVADLPEPARALFTALPAFATAEFGRQALTALGRGLGEQGVRDSIDLLIRRGLLAPAVAQDFTAETGGDAERLRIFPLLRALALPRWAGEPADRQYRSAQALAVFFADYAERQQDRLPVLRTDRGNLTGALIWAEEHGQPGIAIDLAHGLRWYWGLSGQWQAIQRHLGWALAAATARREMSVKIAEIGLVYGQASFAQGTLEDEAVLRRSLAWFQTAGNRLRESEALAALGNVAIWSGRLNEAQELLRQAETLATPLGDARILGDIAFNQGQLAQLDGRRDAAIAANERALAYYRAIDLRQNIGLCLSQLGNIAFHWGRDAEARRHLEEGRQMLHETGDLQNEALTLIILAQVLAHRDPAAAAALVEEGLALCRTLSNEWDEAIGIAVRGDIARRRGDYVEAERNFTEAETRLRTVRDHRWLIRLHGYRGQLAEAQGNAAEAEAQYRAGLVIADAQEQEREGAIRQLDLGRLLTLTADRRGEGCVLLRQALDYFKRFDLPQSAETARLIERAHCP